MKKCTLYMLITALLCALMPQITLAANDDLPAVIYLAKDFEAQEIGEVPYGFRYGTYTSTEDFEVAVIEKDGNSENKAMKVTGTDEPKRESASHSLQYAPLSKNFVVSMNVNLSETAVAKNIYMYKDAVESRAAHYLDVGGSFTLMSFTDTLSVVGKRISGIELKRNTWYNIAVEFDMTKHTANVYVDGKLRESGVSLGSMVNICEMRINVPAAGGEYYIDDVRIYEWDNVLSEEEFQADLAEWKASELCPPEKYEISRLYQYNQHVFRALYNKFVTRIGGKKVYKDNKYYDLPAQILTDGDDILVPVRGFGDMFGAETQWDADLHKLTLTYGDKKMECVEGEDVYYVNGRISKLYYPAKVEKGTFYMHLDVLGDFLGIDYRIEDELINFGDEIVLDHDLGPMGKTGLGYAYDYEIMRRISNSLTYDRPTAEEVYEAFYKVNTENVHPRIFVNDFEWIREGMEKDPEFKKVVNSLIGKADNLLDKVTSEIHLYDGLRSTSATVCGNAASLALAYQITRDEKYKERLWQEIEVIDKAASFNPNHFLDIGGAATSMGKVYSWMYNDFTEEQRKIVEEIIYRNILLEFEKTFKTPYYSAASAYTYSGGNQIIIINGGGIMSAVAVFDKYPELCSEIISNSLRSMENGFRVFAPDGGYPEGLSYWLYTCDYMPGFFNCMDCAFGTSFGIEDSPGLMSTVYYGLSTKGSTGGYPSGDAAEQSPFHGWFMWHAKKTGDNGMANLRKANMSATEIDMFNWMFDTDDGTGGLESIEGDAYISNIGNVTMRTGWANGDTSIFFHGGANNDGHGHIDIGTFQFDMLGERWACELPKEDYNLTGYGSYVADGTYNEYKGPYYRNSGEGHNMVMANLGAENPFGMPKAAKAKVIRHAFGDTMSYAIMDLTESNELYEYGVRGIKLDKLQNEVIVQDNFKSSTPTHFWWFMNLKNTDVELSEDGKSAILSKNNKRIWASIISEGDEKFEVLEAKPLDRLDTPKAPLETANEGYSRLGINNPSTDHLKLTVVFKPLVGDETVPSMIPEDIPMEAWQPIEGERAQIDGATVDGEPLENFSPGIYAYDIFTVTEKDPIPKIEVTANEKYDVEVINATTLPGVTTVIMKQKDETVGMYTFAITPLNDTTKFLNDKQIPIVDFDVTSEPQVENGAANLFDATHTTKFATDEIGGAVTIDFGEVKTVKEIMMAFVSGASRTENVKIEYSTDGENYTVAFEGTNNGKTADYQSFDVGTVPARYIRVSFYGNNSGSNWVSVTELCAFTE